MQAIEIETNVDESHMIKVSVPADWATRRVKVIILQQDDNAEPIKKVRQFGGLEGKIHIADDFDDELPDTFWLDGNP